MHRLNVTWSMSHLLRISLILAVSKTISHLISLRVRVCVQQEVKRWAQDVKSEHIEEAGSSVTLRSNSNWPSELRSSQFNCLYLVFDCSDTENIP